MKPRNVLADIREVLLGNATYKLVSLAFALMAWIWVQSEQVVEERARVKLEWKLPEGLMPVEPAIETATVTVEGVQAFVRAVRQKEMSVVIDISRAKEGEVNLDLSDRPVIGLPSQVRVVTISPSTLKMQLDRIQKRRVTVVPVTRGEVAEGYRLEKITVTPDRVELTGPFTVMRDLKEVSTDAVDISGLREDAEFDVGLGVREGQLTPTAPTHYSVQVDLEPVLKQRTFDQVPVMVRGAGYVSGIDRVAVTLEGPADQLDAADPGEVSVMVFVPEGWAEAQGEARQGKGAGLRYEVLRTGGTDVKVLEVVPASIPVAPVKD